MKQLICFLFLLGILIFNNYGSAAGYNVAEAKLSRTKRLTGVKEVIEPRMTNVTNVTDIYLLRDTSFMTHVRSSTGFVCSGVIINKFYVVALSEPLKPYENSATDLILSAKCPQPPMNCTNGAYRKAKEIKMYPGCVSGGIVDCIALIRVCPAFPVKFFVPAFLDLIIPTVEVYMFQYSSTGRIVSTSKKIAQTTECENIAGWNADKHICLVESPKIYGNSTDDLKGVILADVDTLEVYGFLVYPQMTPNPGHGEIAISLANADYKAWYETHGNPTKYEYTV